MKNDNIQLLKSQNDKLKREVNGWKAAARREGFYGILIGGVIFLIIGMVIGRSL